VGRVRRAPEPHVAKALVHTGVNALAPRLGLLLLLLLLVLLVLLVVMVVRSDAVGDRV
jgi:uncharacterized membrane protein YjgN (DUF898 family)